MSYHDANHQSINLIIFCTSPDINLAEGFGDAAAVTNVAISFDIEVYVRLSLLLQTAHSLKISGRNFVRISLDSLIQNGALINICTPNIHFVSDESKLRKHKGRRRTPPEMAVLKTSVPVPALSKRVRWHTCLTGGSIETSGPSDPIVSYNLSTWRD